jgi:hypothetical protein
MDTIRDRCGVCGEKGNHGDVPHTEAVRSRYRGPEDMSEFLRWLESRREMYQSGGEAYPEFTIDRLIRDFKRRYLID